MAIGERIISLRKEIGISQGKLAAFLNVSRQAVSKWENDLAIPDMQKMIQLADILNTDVEYLATGKYSEHISQPEITKTVEVQEKLVEKIVEKPVIKVVEKPVTQFVDRIVEKPIIKRVVRIKYYRNPLEFLAVTLLGFLLGVVVGKFL